MTSRPVYCSRARSTASFLNVPPWTTILSPRLSKLEIRITFVKTFSMMERHRPAIISADCLPFRCSVTMLLFMKTVQRLPREAGCLDEKAASAISSTGICKDEAKFSRKEPQPEEQASLTTILVICRCDPDRFHILTADIKDKMWHLLIYLVGSPGVGNGFHNMAFCAESF